MNISQIEQFVNALDTLKEGYKLDIYEGQFRSSSFSEGIPEQGITEIGQECLKGIAAQRNLADRQILLGRFIHAVEHYGKLKNINFSTLLDAAHKEERTILLTEDQEKDSWELYETEEPKVIGSFPVPILEMVSSFIDNAVSLTPQSLTEMQGMVDSFAPEKEKKLIWKHLAQKMGITEDQLAKFDTSEKLLAWIKEEISAPLISIFAKIVGLYKKMPIRMEGLSRFQQAQKIDAWLRSDPAMQGRKELFLDNLGLKRLPPAVCTLKNLRTIYLDHNSIRELPPEIGQLKSLVRLRMWHNELQTFPPEIGQLKSLESIEANGNKIQSLPEQIGDLKSLTDLWLGDNQLKELPRAIGRLNALVNLGVSGNQLQFLPSTFGDLAALRHVELHFNQLQALPPQIGKLKGLKFLGLNGNQLKALPPEIVGCTALEEMFLNKNQLQELPADIGKMPALTTVTILQNPLKELPAVPRRITITRV